MLNSFKSRRNREAQEPDPELLTQSTPTEGAGEVSTEEPADVRADAAQPSTEEAVGTAPRDQGIEEVAAESAGGQVSTKQEAECAPRKKLGGKKPVGGFRAMWQGSSVWRAAVLGIFAYLAFVNVGYFLFLKPIGERLNGLQERAAVLNDFAVIQESSAAIADFTAGLMSGDQRMTVMSEVNTMAKDSGVRVVGDPELLLPREVSESITEYPIRLRVKGTYSEMGEFLSLLESSPRFVQVEHVEIQSDIESRDSESEATLLLAVASWEG